LPVFFLVQIIYRVVSAIVLVASFLLTFDVYGFTVDRICSLAIAGQRLSIIQQVHGLCFHPNRTSQKI